jgi:hypothetical protein
MARPVVAWVAPLPRCNKVIHIHCDIPKRALHSDAHTDTYRLLTRHDGQTDTIINRMLTLYTNV